ncbi:hypothetical protein [Nitratireductor basaltis]|uniref:hypothetical protein n=1 Tax=Nitratireductor basaltis TaxID=472175 RepID=UPI0013785108|nr:hypothetical protein [Nitratireductor basaltis]
MEHGGAAFPSNKVISSSRGDNLALPDKTNKATPQGAGGNILLVIRSTVTQSEVGKICRRYL